jgi:hypothetical protein
MDGKVYGSAPAALRARVVALHSRGENLKLTARRACSVGWLNPSMVRSSHPILRSIVHKASATSLGIARSCDNVLGSNDRRTARLRCNVNPSPRPSRLLASDRRTGYSKDRSVNRTGGQQKNGDTPEVHLTPTAVSTVSEFSPCGTDFEPHDAHATSQRKHRTVGSAGCCALRRYMLSVHDIDADDTSVKVLPPRRGRLRRDPCGPMSAMNAPGVSRSAGGAVPVLPKLHSKNPQRHLARFTGKLQVEAYASFEPLFVPSAPGMPVCMEEISRMAHARRRFFDLYAALAGPLQKTPPSMKCYPRSSTADLRRDGCVQTGRLL